ERCRAFLKAGADGERPNAESLLKALDVGDQLTASISESAMRIEDIVDGLSHLISLDSAERKLHDLRDGIKTVLSVLSPQIVEGIQVTTDFPDRPVHVLCDPARLNQAILNILQNAITAVGRKGTIAVRAGIQAGRVQVTITDDGPGMTADVLKNAFEFSFSEREGRVRLRLGLATSRRTIEAIGGTLQIDSTPGQGTQVTIALPATAPA
ncbi:MAG TPA: HAMP domain-containing sensor histidine kinase, partial [candidate division Zixibacteria bacterium]|nr:HAMP domain-containing sensor histidine kinase [candidate division Zixibacteria bacterium]